VPFGVRQQLLVPLASDLAVDIWMDRFSSSCGVVMTTNEKGCGGQNPFTGKR
jgi:hypothetical protein